MKISIFKNTFVPLLSLCAAMHAGDATASWYVTGSLGSEGAVDYAQIYCFDDGVHGAPSYLEIKVHSLDAASPAVEMSVQIQKDTLATSTTDSSGSDSAGSRKVKLEANSGLYNVFINSTSSGAHNYKVTAHCMTNRNVDTGINAWNRQLQDQ